MAEGWYIYQDGPPGSASPLQGTEQDRPSTWQWAGLRLSRGLSASFWLPPYPAPRGPETQLGCGYTTLHQLLVWPAGQGRGVAEAEWGGSVYFSFGVCSWDKKGRSFPVKVEIALFPIYFCSTPVPTGFKRQQGPNSSMGVKQLNFTGWSGAMLIYTS